MTLKQISPKQRIIFLKLFTKGLILASIKERQTNDIIEAEKLKQKFVEPNITPEEAIQKTIMSSAFQPSKYPITEHPYQIKSPTPLKIMPKQKPPRPLYPQQPFSNPFIKRLKKRVRRQQVRTIPSIELQTKAQALQQIQPQYQPKPIGFNLGKIEILLQDPSLQSLECPGPGKNILVKKGNQITPTRTILSQQEINNIINSFSQQAKIPSTGGILKAAVGNLIISAVISEFVGSRFIISKLAPPLVQQQPFQPQTPIQPQQQSQRIIS